MALYDDDPGWRQHWEMLEELHREEEERLEFLYGVPRLASTICARRNTKSTTVTLELDVENLPPLLTVRQTAALLQTTAKGVRRKIDRNQLPVIRDGRRVLIRRDALLRKLKLSTGRQR